jgi:negative regulator of replication initiation
MKTAADIDRRLAMVQDISKASKPTTKTMKLVMAVKTHARSNPLILHPLHECVHKHAAPRGVPKQG